MSRRLRYGITHTVLAAAITLTLAACQQQAPSAPPAQTAAPAPRTAAPAAPPTAAPASAPAAPAAAPVADSTGVAECDDYLSKYQACVDSRVPEASRAAFRQSLEQTRAAWRSAVATPGGKNGLTALCTQARDAAKTSMAAYGCSNF